MDNGLLPRRYAKALYKFADEKKVADKIYTLMENLESTFQNNHDLQTAIANPFVSLNQKIDLLNAAVGEKDDIFNDFIKLLDTNNRLDIIRSVALAYTQLYRKENHIHLVTVTSAAPLSDADRKRITNMIDSHIGNATAQYTFTVNPDLIGGFVVKIDNELLDASVRNEFAQLRRSLMV